MDWLLHNPIASMDGPHFLVLYGSVLILIFATCWWKLRPSDPMVFLSPPPVPAEPDPYEIAYLRNGAYEVAATVVFGLIQRGYLRIAEQQRWSQPRAEQAPDHPDPRHLSQIERCTFERFSAPYTDHKLPAEIQEQCARYQDQLVRQRLLTPLPLHDDADRVGVKGGLVIVGLGGYKLVVELATGGSGIGWLIAMGAASFLILWFITHVPRLSPRGQAYLEQLRLAFGRLKEQATRVTSAAADPTLLLLVGLFGVGVLAGTPYASYEQMFQRRVLVVGCGGGCGSCGGGGCGGCGGCGG